MSANLYYGSQSTKKEEEEIMKFKDALRSLFRNKEEEKELQEFKILILQLNKQLELMDKEVGLLTKGYLQMFNDLGRLEPFAQTQVIRYEI